MARLFKFSSSIWQSFLQIRRHRNWKCSNGYLLLSIKRDQHMLEHSTYEQAPAMDNALLTDAYLESLNFNKMFDASEVSENVRTLHALAYQQLNHIPWLQNHHHQISFIQLTMNNKVSEFMQPIHQHLSFNSLIQEVKRNITHFDSKELVSTYAFLLWLGVRADDNNIVKLQLEISSRCHHFDLVLISLLADAMRTLNRTDLKIMSKLIQRFDDILPQFGTGAADDAYTLSCAAASCGQYLSFNFSTECLQNILLLTDVPGALQNPEYIGAYLRFCRKLNVAYFPENSGGVDYYNTLLTKCRDAASLLTDQMDANHIAEICSNLKMCRAYTPYCARPIKARALKLLEQPNLRICDVSNLLYAFNREISPTVKRNLEAILYRHIDDCDVLVLSNLVDSLMAMGCNNRDIHIKVHEKIIEHSDNIIHFVTRFRRVLRFLSQYNFYSPVLQAKFYESVLQGLGSYLGFSCYSISMISRYLLPSMQYFIPESLFQKQLEIIPHMRLQDLYKIIVGLNGMKQPWTRQMQNQILQLQHSLHNHVLDKLQDPEDFGYVFQAALAMVVHSKIKDPIVTDKILNMFPKFMKDLSDNNMQSVSRLFHRLIYYIPAVCDDVTDHVINRAETLEFDKLLSAVLMMSKVGHTPHRLEELLQACQQIYQRQTNEIDVKTTIMFMQAICQLQLYPSELLQHIFSIQYMEQIDKFFEEMPEYREVVESLLMKLNRQMVLECPELDIPWFHEQYCRENVVSHKYEKSKFHLDIEQAIFEIVEGNAYFKAGSYTPYYYFINFECIIGPDKKPLDIVNVVGKEMPAGAKRLAVLGMTESQYCYNSKHLCGYEQLKKRHLELMGYTVVLVPHFDWYSMALSDWSSKLEYLKQKMTQP